MQHIIKTVQTLVLTGITALSLTACDGDGDGGDGNANGIDIAGMYADDFGTSHSIDDTSWTQSFPGSSPSAFAFVSIDNDGQFAVAQNDAGNEFAPSQFSKFEWTFDDAGDLFFCQSAFDAMTAEDAAASSADSADLDAGCGGFGWSRLTTP